MLAGTPPPYEGTSRAVRGPLARAKKIGRQKVIFVDQCSEKNFKFFSEHTSYDRELFVLSFCISFIFVRQHLIKLRAARSSRDTKNGIKIVRKVELQKRIADDWRHK